MLLQLCPPLQKAFFKKTRMKSVTILCFWNLKLHDKLYHMKQSAEDLREKHTKIVATIGSSSDSEEVLEQMIRFGLNIARINMSHGDHEEHHRQIKTIRKAAKKLGYHVEILVDLGGSKVRVGQMEKGTMLEEGKLVTLTTKECMGNTSCIPVSYLQLPKKVKAGQDILISDGKRKLRVLSTNGTDEIKCRILVGGLVTSKRGLNFPGTKLHLPVITDKDKEDLKFGIEHKAKYIAFSFVREPQDVLDLRNLLNKYNYSALTISKMETKEAMSNLKEIIKASDGIMVARGDLAMEIGMHHVPVAQKRLLEAAKSFGKFSIVATQVLDSMENNPIPTRAEVSDIATAVFEGADAIMLSAESASGKYPAESVQTISRVVKACEESEYMKPALC